MFQSSSGMDLTVNDYKNKTHIASAIFFLCLKSFVRYLIYIIVDFT